METKEKELLEKLAPTHPDVKALWNDHVLYEKQISALESKKFLTSTEEQQMRQLKKQKLDGKTKLVTLLNQYDKEEM